MLALLMPALAVPARIGDASSLREYQPSGETMLYSENPDTAKSAAIRYND